MTIHRTFALLALLLASCSPGGLNVVGQAPDSLLTDMVAHWSCDEGTGGTLVDHSGNGYDGVILGATWIPGRFGNGIHFESGDSVTVGESFPQANKSWSVSLWVRPPNADLGDSYVTLISTEIPFVGGWEMNARVTSWDMEYHFGYPRQSDAGDAYEYYTCANCVDVGVWTHLVAVVDSSQMQLSFFKNSVLLNQSPITDLIQPGSPALYLGRWSKEGRYFVGDLDDIVVYRRALTQPEISSLYAQPAPSTPG